MLIIANLVSLLPHIFCQKQIHTHGRTLLLITSNQIRGFLETMPNEPHQLKKPCHFQLQAKVGGA